MLSQEDINLCIYNLRDNGFYAYEHNGLVIISVDEVNQSFILHDEEVLFRARNERILRHLD